MLPLVEPLEVLQRATENPVNLNQGDTSSQHHHTASSPHIQLSPGNSVNGILCPNTFTLPGCAHILNSNTQAFGRHTQCQDLCHHTSSGKKQPGPRQAPSMGSNTQQSRSLLHSWFKLAWLLYFEQVNIAVFILHKIILNIKCHDCFYNFISIIWQTFHDSCTSNMTALYTKRERGENFSCLGSAASSLSMLIICSRDHLI